MEHLSVWLVTNKSAGSVTQLVKHLAGNWGVVGSSLTWAGDFCIVILPSSNFYNYPVNLSSKISFRSSIGLGVLLSPKKMVGTAFRGGLKRRWESVKRWFCWYGMRWFGSIPMYLEVQQWWYRPQIPWRLTENFKQLVLCMSNIRENTIQCTQYDEGVRCDSNGSPIEADIHRGCFPRRS